MRLCFDACILSKKMASMTTVLENVCNPIKLRLTQLGISMTIDELLAANPNAQYEWLKVKYAARAEQAEDDVVSDLVGRAWEEPLGCYFHLDQSRFDDLIKYPEEYELGGSLRQRLGDISDARAVAIDEGAVLTERELNEVKNIVLDQQGDNEGGINCSGFTVKIDGDNEVFAAYTGPVSGPGNINYSFYRIFKSKALAISHFCNQGDLWWDVH